MKQLLRGRLYREKSGGTYGNNKMISAIHVFVIEPALIFFIKFDGKIKQQSKTGII